MSTQRYYALSIKQPWAALLVSGVKGIEIRRWATRIRGKVLIHAARIPDPRPEGWKWVAPSLEPQTRLVGGIIGAAVLRDVLVYRDLATFASQRDQHLNETDWFQQPPLFGFRFESQTAIPFLACKGNVRFFTVDYPKESTCGPSDLVSL